MMSTAFVAPAASVRAASGTRFSGQPLCARRALPVSVACRRAAVPRMAAADGDGSDRVPGKNDPAEKPADAKEMLARYGGAYLGSSVFLSLISFGVLYVLIDSGVNIKPGIDAFGNWLATTPLGRPQILDSVPESGGTFVLAYVAHKVTSPIRFPPTVVLTEVVARAISKNQAKEE